MVRLLIGLAALLLTPVPAMAEWRVAETAHFIIYSKSNPGEIEKLAERVESYDKLMRMATGINDGMEPVKVRIYQVDGIGDVQAAAGDSNSGIAGYYDSNIFGPYLVTPRHSSVDSKYFTPELVLQHEYAHHFMLQYFPAIYPSWYVEGFAELIGSSKMLDDGRIGYGMPAKHRGNDIAAYWVPLQELLVKEKVIYFDTYGQGWALTHFFTFDDARASQLRRYLGALSAGKPLKEAAQVFGDLSRLDREARRYVTNSVFHYKPVKVEIRRPVVEKIRPLRAAEAALMDEWIAFRDDDLLLIRSQGERGRERRLREANLKRIRQKAARFPNDPFALYLLAEAEAAASNYREAEAATDRLLALQPAHVGGMVRKSLLLSQSAAQLQGPARAAKAAEARRLAVRANRAANDDPLPLLAYYQSYRLSGEKAPPKAVEGLMQAVSTLPRNTAIRKLLVDQLAAERRWREAIAWLLPLANSPHESPRRAAAREQLKQLEAELQKELARRAVEPVATGS